jgi:hypothetical protein
MECKQKPPARLAPFVQLPEGRATTLRRTAPSAIVWVAGIPGPYRNVNRGGCSGSRWRASRWWAGWRSRFANSRSSRACHRPVATANPGSLTHPVGGDPAGRGYPAAGPGWPVGIVAPRPSTGAAGPGSAGSDAPGSLEKGLQKAVPSSRPVLPQETLIIGSPYGHPFRIAPMRLNPIHRNRLVQDHPQVLQPATHPEARIVQPMHGTLP